MHSDFSAKGKAARDMLTVPELSMELIRRRSHSATTRARARVVALSVSALLVIVGATVGFGAKMYEGVRVWLTGSNAAVVVNSFVLVREPTASDLRKIVAGATFPVTLPVGVPAGSHVAMVMFAPRDHPNSITLQYRNEASNFNVGISLFDASVVNTDSSLLPAGAARPAFRQGYHWQVGREMVFLPREHVSLTVSDKIEMAMLRTSASDSLAVTDRMLHTVTVVGSAPMLANIAERYAPANSHAVLLDREQIRRVSDLALQNKPLLDSRIVYLSHIPSVNGDPDYLHATMRWPKTIVISATGVRAIAAVLRSPTAGHQCGCEILFDQPDKTTYWVWELPLSASATVRKYSIDAGTLLVKQERV